MEKVDRCVLLVQVNGRQSGLEHRGGKERERGEDGRRWMEERRSAGKDQRVVMGGLSDWLQIWVGWECVCVWLATEVSLVSHSLSRPQKFFFFTSHAYSNTNWTKMIVNTHKMRGKMILSCWGVWTCVNCVVQHLCRVLHVQYCLLISYSLKIWNSFWKKSVIYFFCAKNYERHCINTRWPSVMDDSSTFILKCWSR